MYKMGKENSQLRCPRHSSLVGQSLRLRYWFIDEDKGHSNTHPRFEE